ncbi:MAG: hypothetical protein Q8N89_13005 [Azonexus sp.]|nr:hypothetical protein [Azonexus sp.]
MAPIARSTSNSGRSLICKKSQPSAVGFFVVEVGLLKATFNHPFIMRFAGARLLKLLACETT